MIAATAKIHGLTVVTRNVSWASSLSACPAQIWTVLHHAVGQTALWRRDLRLTGCVASQYLSAALTRVCHPGPLARRAPTTSWSRRMATCSLAGFLLGPRVLGRLARVSATPPPGVTVPSLQSIFSLREVRTGAADFAAAISAELKRAEEVIGFFAIGITTGNQMRGVVTARSPHQEDDSALPHA